MRELRDLNDADLKFGIERVKADGGKLVKRVYVTADLKTLQQMDLEASGRALTNKLLMLSEYNRRKEEGKKCLSEQTLKHL